VAGTSSRGRPWALAPSVTGLPAATAGLALRFRSGMLDIWVRSVHHARFSTRCQGRPAAPEGRVIFSELYMRSSSGQIYHTMPNAFTARWTPAAVGQSRERARTAHEERTIRRLAFVAPLLHPTMDRAGLAGGAVEVLDHGRGRNDRAAGTGPGDPPGHARRAPDGREGDSVGFRPAADRAQSGGSGRPGGVSDNCRFGS
jgi:hypothetical protein